MSDAKKQQLADAKLLGPSTGVRVDGVVDIGNLPRSGVDVVMGGPKTAGLPPIVLVLGVIGAVWIAKKQGWL